MSERIGGGSTESYQDPEVIALLQFLETYDKIQEIQAWLVEASASVPMLKATRRARLQKLMQQLGIDTSDPDDPGGYKQLASLKAEMSDRSLHPRPRVEIPGPA